MKSKEKAGTVTTKWWELVPNVLTIVRIILVPIFIVLMVLQHLDNSVNLLIASLLVFCLAAYTDHLDGKLARRWEVVSDFGKLLDPIADKALMISAFVLLSLFQGLWWWFTLVVILREVAVTLLRMSLLRSGVVLPASKGGKIKTSLQILMVFLWMLFGICYPFNTQVGVVIMYLAIAALIAAFVATVLSGMVYFLDAHDNRKAQANAGSADNSEEAEPADQLKVDAEKLEETADRAEKKEEDADASDSQADEPEEPESEEEESEEDEPVEELEDDSLGFKMTWKPRKKIAEEMETSKDPEKDQETENPQSDGSQNKETKPDKSQTPGEEFPEVSQSNRAEELSDGTRDTEHKNQEEHKVMFPSRRARREQQAKKAAEKEELAGEKDQSTDNSADLDSRMKIPDLSKAGDSPAVETDQEAAGESPEPESAGTTPRFAMTRSQLRRQKKK